MTEPKQAVEGALSKKPIGVFHYDKRLRSGRLQHVRVSVYALEVARERDQWLEKAQREKQWTNAPAAVELVEEPELRALLAAFKP